MPRRVDRDQRRAEIVDAYLRLVARSGVAGATSRALAVEAQIAAGALWHYFAGLDDVLRAAFERVYRETNARIDSAVAGLRGLAAVEGMAAEVLPHDAQTRDEAAIAVSFWGLLPAHADFRAYTLEVERDWNARLAAHLAEAVADGELVPATPVPELSDTLLSVFDAAQVRGVQDSPVADPGRQRAMRERLLDPWRVSPG